MAIITKYATIKFLIVILLLHRNKPKKKPTNKHT
jgi:hypothetical protein